VNDYNSIGKGAKEKGSKAKDASKVGNIAKGMKGFGKSSSTKDGEKSEKNESLGKAKSDPIVDKKKDKTTSHSLSKLTKTKGKDGKNRRKPSISGSQRHLNEIAYHQSHIEYFKELLSQAES